MKRNDALKELIETVGAYDSWVEQCEYMLSRLEFIGMLPPSIRILTPLGARSFYETNEWEENINIDEAGYDKNDPDYENNKGGN